MTRLSVITPFLNEANNLPLFKERALAVMESADRDWELLLVDDHSTDESSAMARRWAEADSRVKYLRLSRNCGSHTALAAGLAHATGDCAVLLVADLQDPPEMIPDLVAKWREGYDVVFAVRVGREGESWLTKALAGVYYRVMKWLAFPDIPRKAIDFPLLDRKVIDAYNVMPEKNTSLFLTILWMGFRRTWIEYVKQARHPGKSKWTLSKKVNLFIDSVVSFSCLPIRLMSALGIAVWPSQPR